MVDEKRIATDIHIIESRLEEVWENIKNENDLEDIRNDIKDIAWDLKLLYKDLGGEVDGLF